MKRIYVCMRVETEQTDYLDMPDEFAEGDLIEAYNTAHPFEPAVGVITWEDETEDD